MKKLLIALALIVSACASSNNLSSVMASWVGQPASDLRSQWGEPAAVYKYAKDTTCLIYDVAVGGTTTAGYFFPGYKGMVTYVPPRETAPYRSIRAFLVDGSGIIRAWTVRRQ